MKASSLSVVSGVSECVDGVGMYYDWCAPAIEKTEERVGRCGFGNVIGSTNSLWIFIIRRTILVDIMYM